jgi:hypothetical protein
VEWVWIEPGRSMREMTMFKETVLTWMKEQDITARDQLADDYARRLEEIFNQEVTRQLEPLGKAAEFERMLLYDSQYTHKYLNQTIPSYYGFRAEIFNKARKIILGE